MVFTMSAALMSALPATGAIAAPPQEHQAAPGKQSERQRALAEASETGNRVEVTGARTEFATTYANPDGETFRLEQSAVPVRVRSADGTWTRPDATLAFRADGSVAPKAAAVGLSFSAGGDGSDLVTIERDGRSMSLGWPGRLPEPKLDGDSAVYSEVLPGTDLRMTATVSGFRELLVVKTPEAAASPELDRIDFEMRAKGLQVTGTKAGGMTATDANAKEVFVSPPALMWDSHGDTLQGGGGAEVSKAASAPTAKAPKVATAPKAEVSKAASAPTAKAPKAASAPTAKAPKAASAPTAKAPKAGAAAKAGAVAGSAEASGGAADGGPATPDRTDGPAAGDHSAQAGVEVDKDSVTVVPDAKMLAQTDKSAYPLYIDPAVTWGEDERTLLRSDGYKDYAWDNGTDNVGKGAGECGSWSGYYCGPGYVQRLYFEFSPSQLAGKNVLDATFTITEPWAFQCSARTVDLVRTDNISSSTSWSSRPKELDWMVDRNVSAGRGSLCDPDSPDAPIEFNDSPDESNENLTPTVRDFAAGKFSRLTLEIRAHDEGDTSAWKRFKNDASLVVDYVGKPNYPSPFGLVAGSGSVCSKDSAKPSVVSDTTPQVTATVRTLSGGSSSALLRAAFQVEKSSSGTWSKVGGVQLSPTSGHIASGAKTSPSVTSTLTEGTLYRVAAWTYSYWNNYASHLSSGSAGYCYFKVDPSAPKAPTVTIGAPYSACAATCVPAGGPGVKGTFTFGPATGDTNASYQYKESTSNTWSPPIKGATVKQDIVPQTPGTYMLEVRATDSLNRPGASQVVAFLVKEGDGPVGRWHFDEDSGAAIDSSTTVTANQDNATLASGATRDGRGRRGEVWTDSAGKPIDQPRTDTGLSLNGSTGYAATSGPVLETRSAYTVSAWVWVDKPTSDVLVLSQSGKNYSPFALWYTKATGRFTFGVKEKDEDTGTAYFGVSAAQATPAHTWAHVAGTYDPAAQTASLYLNGKLQGTRTAVAANWSAGGPLQIGRYLWAGTYQRNFSGVIDEVAAWQRVLTPKEIADEAKALNGNGKADVELVAEWKAANGSGTSVPDTTSGYGRTLALEGGAALNDGDITLDGVDDAATTAGPVVDDTGSFTVTVKAALDREKVLAQPIGSIGQVTGQRTADGSSWGLWFELTGKEKRLNDDDEEVEVPVGFWRFGRVGKDGITDWVSSDSEADLGTPVRLTGVFDSLDDAGPVLRLYVGRTQNDADRAYTAIAGSGDFAVGKGAHTATWGHFLPGRISEVCVWTGAMTDSEQIGDVIGD
ncbi:LamG domain-containing protein [Streptomyces sp. NPDC048514]|uniref:LamG domain-containing protein n=1 Tax=Streptomyces sp. NPDC048514 TaxID=3365564 RepID=UPI00371E3F18